MFEYIHGKLADFGPTYVVIDTNGVGYGINVSLSTSQAIKDRTTAKLYIHLYVREDDQRLYGFAEKLERQLFRLLLSVSGVGTNTALIILSSMTPAQVRQAVLSEDVESFRAVKGIGPKTAKRIILDLKDKLNKSFDKPVGNSIDTPNNTMRNEALSALVNLGFKQKEVLKAFEQVSGDAKSVEELIKKSLILLSK